MADDHHQLARNHNVTANGSRIRSQVRGAPGVEARKRLILPTLLYSGHRTVLLGIPTDQEVGQDTGDLWCSIRLLGRNTYLSTSSTHLQNVVA